MPFRPEQHEEQKGEQRLQSDTLKRYADIDLSRKPVLALTTYDAHAKDLSNLFFFFFFGITARRKINARLKQKINTNTFPGQTGTSQALHNLLPRTLT